MVHIWEKDEPEQIIEISIGYITHSDVNLVTRSAILIQEAVSNPTSSNTSMARQRVVQALVDGPLRLDGPRELFNLQTDSIKHVGYALRLNVRNSIRESLPGLDRDPSRLIAVANELVQADGRPTSDDLLQSIVDYAIRVENDDWGRQAVGLIGILEPSVDAMNRIDREAIRTLNERYSLSGPVKDYLVDDSEKADQEASE